jgi:hypothetical protein
MRRPLVVVAAALAVSMSLSGCVLLPLLRPTPQPPQQTPVAPDGDPIAEGPVGWRDLEPCDPSDRWVWVEGYPAEQMESAGLSADCGGTYFDSDVPTYVSAGDRSVSDAELDALRALLEADGYTLTDTTFVHPDADTQPGLVGSFFYERNAGDASAYEAIYIVNIWPGGDPVAYNTFVDYESPATRELQV